jgi:ATP-binding cassette subfamily B protein
MAEFLKFSRIYIFPHFWWYFTGILALAITNLLTLEIPKLGKKIINGFNTTDPHDLKGVALIIVSLGVLQILVRSLSRILIFWPTRKMEVIYKTDLFNHLLSAPQVFYEKFGLGDLVSRITNDVGHIRVLFAFGFLMVVNFIFLGLFVFTQMLATNYKLALACLVPLTLLFIIAKYAVPKMHKISLRNQQSIAELTNKITETFVNVHIIQAASASQTFIKRTDEANSELLKSNIKLAVLQTIVFPAIQLLSGFAQVTVLLYGGHLILENSLSVGDIMVFNVYIGYLAFPLTAIGIILAVYQRAKTALNRTQEILAADQEGKVIASSTSDSLKKSKHSPALLEIKNLTYPAESPILKNVNLKIEHGVRVGIFGAIGSGKSTLFNLITRVYNPPVNTIFLNGKDILSFEPNDLRKKIAYALQESQLFSESIENNIFFGVDTSDLSSELYKRSLNQAAESVKIKNEVLSFPKKWKTEIGERGIKLSGGQKQRLALSRILIRTSDLVILDDALSAADQITERIVLNEIRKRCKSLLLSSHRLGTLKHCDELIHISDGKVSKPNSFQEMRELYPEFLKDDETK